jgi:flagellar basal-body rod modification protein FlgD
MTTAVGNSSAIATLQQASGVRAGADPARELNDRFLKLLVAQMNNQDPLNPLDNAQVTSQMAQINTVTGINGLNETVEQLIGQFARLEAMQAAQLTGRSVLVTGTEARVATAGAPTAFGVELGQRADALVRTQALGKAEAGISRFEWDGRNDAGSQVAAGKYSITVKAMAGGKEIGATPLVARRIDGVSIGDGGATLNFAGGGSARYGDIRQII